MLRLFGLIAPASLAACAAAQPTATEDEKSAAVAAYNNCLYVAAQRLDDGVSDPGTIGRAIASLCRPELDASVEVFTRGTNSQVRGMFYERRIAEENDSATLAVLRLRRDLQADGATTATR
jgi:hypothetical protein